MIKDTRWKLIKRHLKYNDEELELFKNNLANSDIVDKLKILANIEIKIEVISSRGCNSGYEVGETFYFDGPGNLIAEKSSRNNCVFLLGVMSAPIYAIHELIYSGIKPDEILLRLNRVGCPDVGVENCGWGRVIVKISIEKK